MQPTSLDDEAPLGRRLPPLDDFRPDDVLDRFLDYVAEKGLSLYPAQEEAILEIIAGKNVILATPTGSGKSLVALAMQFLALSDGRRSVYTTPIKALASEKFFHLCRELGPRYVGLLTGDAAVNRDARVICCTAEVLSNWALRDGENADIDYVIMDEFHYYSDNERGVAWQIPLLSLPQARFLLMSATLGDMKFFEDDLTTRTGHPTSVVRSKDRPVPLDFEYAEVPLHESVQKLIRAERAPVYIVNFTQRSAAETAQALLSMDYCTKEEKRAITEATFGFEWSSPYGKEMQRFIRHGIGVHHAGLLPKYRLLVEKLAQKGLLKIVSGTDTLGVGVNIPIRTVLFTKLCKYDGEKTAILKVRDFQQISGRAGRKGFDDRGTVVAQAPEHVIENMRLEAKAGDDPVKKKRIVRRKPPEKGYVHWDKQTFEKLINSPPEPLVSKFKVSHGLLVSTLERTDGGGCRALKGLLNNCHEPPGSKKHKKREALTYFRSLVEAKILTLVPLKERDGGPPVRVHVDLQEDFSIHHALGLYLIDTLKQLDPLHPEYGLDVLTLVESILENPELILQKQVDRAKTEKLAELKAAGVEYEDRMEELAKIEHPKPRADFIYDTFNAFAELHPWVGDDNIRPKAVAREMYENFLSFDEMVRELGLERIEGQLLRYLSDVYKALVQTVPALARTDATDDIAVYFGELVRGVDSSLLDEWERMMRLGADAFDPSKKTLEEPEPEKARPDITRDAKAFMVLVRNSLFHVIRALSRRDFETAATLVRSADPENPWTKERLEPLLGPYFEEHATIRTDPGARSPQGTMVEKHETHWQVSQVLYDPEDNNDWMIVGKVDLDASRESGKVVFVLEEIRT